MSEAKPSGHGGRDARRRDQRREPDARNDRGGRDARRQGQRREPDARKGNYPDHLRDQIEEHLAALRFSEEQGTEGLEEAMRYSLLAGGKRIRPVLALATASALGRPSATVLPLAAALELIHTYSLIHDDLPAMDDDELRRGRPTCHVKYGDDVAILAGDGLYAEAFRHVLREQAGEPRRVVEALAQLASATGVNGMVGGQYIDVRSLVPEGTVSLRRMHELKTGRLIAASVECVLLLEGEGVDSTRLSAFRAYAAELGVLFQIVDDILDVTGTEDALGKPRGSDARHGKLTYVSQYGVAGARRMAAEAHGSARAALDRAAGARAMELQQITDFIYTRSS